MEARERIIVALDVDDIDKAITLVRELQPHVGYFKIGLEFINSMLASLIVPKDSLEVMGNVAAIRRLFQLLGGRIFWDGKFNDIPNTVAGASRQVHRIGAHSFNVHASAGRKSIEAAVANRGGSKVLGVTVLTSLDEVECISIFGDYPGRKVLKFARVLSGVGADGIICSPQELELLRKQSEFSSLLMVTPGVRPEWAGLQDQKRVMTPGEAIRVGADYLVIGGPITQPPTEVGSPIDAAQLITKEIEEATRGVKNE